MKVDLVLWETTDCSGEPQWPLGELRRAPFDPAAAHDRIRSWLDGGAESFLFWDPRWAPPDPDRTTPIVKSSRPGESGPEVELVRATVKSNKRQLESIRSLFGEQMEEKRATISIQRWEIAPTVFRFTLSEPLPPGEYALAEILPDGMNLFVWDFGVDPTTGVKPTTPPKKKNDH